MDPPTLGTKAQRNGYNRTNGCPVGVRGVKHSVDRASAFAGPPSARGRGRARLGSIVPAASADVDDDERRDGSIAMAADDVEDDECIILPDGLELLGEELECLTVALLKDLLRKRGLRISGSKQELVQRLLAYAQYDEGAEAGTGTGTEEEAEGWEADELLEAEAAEYGGDGDDDEEECIVLGEELECLSVAQLKDMLRRRGLRVSGRKEELVQRLLEADAAAEYEEAAAAAEYEEVEERRET